MFGEESVYLNKIHPDDAKIMDEVTNVKAWGYDRFRQVMINLGILGNGAAVPARNRPDSIHIQGMRSFVDRLSQRTKAERIEYAQAILVDREMKTMVMGKITSGDEKSVLVDASCAPGREGKQVLVGSMHIHPGFEVSHGLSNQDYLSFLTDRREQIMLMGFGEKSILMAMKTSVTPNNLSEETVRRRLGEIEQDYLKNGTGLALLRVVAFNKQVCAEFGLVLYSNGNEGRDLMSRVEVTGQAEQSG